MHPAAHGRLAAVTVDAANVPAILAAQTLQEPASLVPDPAADQHRHLPRLVHPHPAHDRQRLGEIEELVMRKGQVSAGT